MKTIKATASNGKTVEYRIYEYLNQIVVDVRADGKNVATGTPETVGKTVQGRYIYGQIGRVMMANEQVWTDVLAAYNEAKVELERSFNYHIHQLREQRERLAREVQYARQELYHHEHELVERAGMGEAYRYDEAALKREIAKAEADLKAFDDEHPEFVQFLAEEQAERIERNQWM